MADKVVKDKALCYIVRDWRLLVFRQIRAKKNLAQP